MLPAIRATSSLDGQDRSASPQAMNSAEKPAGLSMALTSGRRSTREPNRRRWFRPSSRRSEEHTSELQSLMRISYAVFCLKKKKNTNLPYTNPRTNRTPPSANTNQFTYLRKVNHTHKHQH